MKTTKKMNIKITNRFDKNVSHTATIETDTDGNPLKKSIALGRMDNKSLSFSGNYMYLPVAELSNFHATIVELAKQTGIELE